MGRITCIIPCYNLGRFVETAVNSAINQDTNFERIIVIDDASTDDSRDYIHRLPDKIDKMLNMTNQGYAKTRNLGASMCDTEWMTFLDADDWLYSNYTTEVLREGLSTDGVICPQVEADGVTVAGGIWPAPHNDDLQRLWEQNYVWAASAVRRQAFVEVGGFDPRFEPAADWALWVKIRMKGWRIKGIHKPLWHWRDRPDGLHMGIRDEDIRARMQAVYFESSAGV